MSNKHNDEIGFDPLAWMREEPTPAHTPAQEEAQPVAAEAVTETIEEVIEPAPEPEMEAVTEVVTSNNNSVDLQGKTDITSVQTLKQELSQLLESGSDTIILNAEQVDRADGAALQLLVAFVQKAQQSGRSFEWQNPSSNLLHSAEILGLRQVLQL